MKLIKIEDGDQIKYESLTVRPGITTLDLR